MKKTITYGKENDINLKLVIGLSRTQLAYGRSIQNFLSDYGITTAQFGVLEALYHLGEMRICDIIDKTLSTSGNMTVVIKNLEKEGLIEKSAMSSDKRAFLIRLSPEGETLILKIFEQHLNQISAFFSLLNYEEKLELQKLLKKANGIT